MNTYEIMFIFDPAAGANWEAVEKEVERLMQRAEAEVILTRKLEERRLAYEIAGRKRGLYVLTYFKADGGRIAGLERDAQLSESILRILILRADHISNERMATIGFGTAKEETKSRTTEHKPGARDNDSQADKTGGKSDSAERELVTSGADKPQQAES